MYFNKCLVWFVIGLVVLSTVVLGDDIRRTDFSDYVNLCLDEDGEIPDDALAKDSKPTSSDCEEGKELDVLGYCLADPQDPEGEVNWYYVCRVPPPEPEVISSSPETTEPYPEYPTTPAEPVEEEKSWLDSLMPIIAGIGMPVATGLLLHHFTKPKTPQTSSDTSQDNNHPEQVPVHNPNQDYSVKPIKGCDLVSRDLDFNTPYNDMKEEKLCKQKFCEQKYLKDGFQSVGYQCCKSFYGGEFNESESLFAKGSTDVFSKVCEVARLCEKNRDSFEKEWKVAVDSYNKDKLPGGTIDTCKKACTAGHPSAESFCLKVVEAHRKSFNVLLKKYAAGDDDAMQKAGLAGDVFQKSTLANGAASSGVPLHELDSWAQNVNTPEAVNGLNPGQVEYFNQNPASKEMLDRKIAGLFKLENLQSHVNPTGTLGDSERDSRIKGIYEGLMGKGFDKFSAMTQLINTDYVKVGGKAPSSTSVDTNLHDDTGKSVEGRQSAS